MIIFGLNLPLPEILFIMVILFFGCLVLIFLQLQKLQKMTSDERHELEELEKMATQEQKDLTQIKSYESMQSLDIQKFEKDIGNLEEDTDTLYLRRLAPNVFKLQNYTLWAIKKGMKPEEIKANLLNKGWKDDKLVEMVVDDTLKYMGYFRDRKGKVDLPAVKVEETTKIVRPVKIVQVQAPPIQKTVTKVIRVKSKKRKASKSRKKTKAAKKTPASDDFKDIEKELTRLESDLKSTSKEKKSKAKRAKKTGKAKVVSKTVKKAVKKVPKPKTTAKPAKPVKEVKKKTAKTKAKVNEAKNSKSGSVTVHADKDVDVHVKYN
jgi:hypothetical protein